MTMPIWMANPPEVHSALLSAGPGPGPTLAAANAWLRLGEQFAQSAAELDAILADVRGVSWQGTSADCYVAAHLPYLAWLETTAAECAATAALHAAAAGAYTAAVAIMPSAAELALNHATHAALMATNFFGMNTIPLAVNEADYVRMWVQAAETMFAYQSASAAALTAVPTAQPAPEIVGQGSGSRMDDMGSGTATSGMDMGPPTPPTGLINQIKWMIQQILQQLEFLIKWIFDPSTFTPKQIVQALLHTVWTLVTQLIPDLILHPGTGNFFLVLVYASMALVHASQLVMLVMPYLLPLIAPASLLGVAGLGSLGALGAIALPSGITPAPTVDAFGPPEARAVRLATLSAAPVAGASGPAVHPHASASATGSAATGPPASGAPPPYVVVPAPPFGGELGPQADVSTAVAAQASSARRHTDTTTHPAAAGRRKARAKDLAHRYEYMDLPTDDAPGPDTPVVKSPQGAGQLGFTGTIRADGKARGLIHRATADLVTDDAPLLPGTWSRGGDL